MIKSVEEGLEIFKKRFKRMLEMENERVERNAIAETELRERKERVANQIIGMQLALGLSENEIEEIQTDLQEEMRKN